VSERARPRGWWLGVLLGVGFVAALLWTTLLQSGVECEVCLDYGGGSVCRTVEGADQQTAVAQAMAAACAILSHGVTEAFECQRTPPRTLHCSEP
jgi:hypothetical protein